MRTDPIRTVLIGLGSHARRNILPAIAGAVSWDLAGIVSSHADRSEWDVPVAQSLEDVLAESEPGAVYVATVPSDHVNACITAIEAGIPLVVCEKPLATTRTEVDSILEVARAHDAAVIEVLAYRHHPQWRKISELIASDTLSGLRHAYARFSYPRLPQTDHRNSIAAGGGALLDAGIYPISSALALLGSQIDVTAGMAGPQGDVDTVGWATLVDGDMRTAQVSWEMGSAYTNVLRLVGVSASIEVVRPFSKPADFAEPLTVIGPTGDRKRITYEPADQFTVMLDDVGSTHTTPEWRASNERDITNRWAVIDRVMEQADLSRRKGTRR